MKKWAIFTDFDGTITTTDVGNTMFYEFSKGKTREVVERWRRGEITSKKCLEDECALASATWDDIYRYLEKKKIDKTFISFYKNIRDEGPEIYILSDGFGFYIRHILNRYSIFDVPFFSNDMIITDGRLIPIFPYYGYGCGECANCKKYHIKHLKGNRKAIYIGDGLSDKHVIEEADLVFAKDGLAKYCDEKRIRYISFKNFEDIKLELKGKEIL
ncbi:MAG: MtnX-like HAD-IB family phosphatase [bacterium]